MRLMYGDPDGRVSVISRGRSPSRLTPSLYRSILKALAKISLAAWVEGAMVEGAM
jgi:hypothetical protein